MTTDINRKIRIVHIITRMDRGGAPDIVRLLCQRLDPVRFDVELIYGLTRSPSRKTKEFIRGLGEKATLVPSLRRDIHPFWDARAFFTLYRLLRAKRFDLVHVHTAKAGVLGRLAAKAAGVSRVVYSPHGNVFYGYFGRLGSQLVVLAEKIAALFCQRLHALTQLEARDLVAFGVCSRKKIDVIASGVELDVLRSQCASREEARRLVLPDETGAVGVRVFLVGMVGRLEPIKGAQYFIEAAGLILREMDNVKFLIVGDGSLRKELEEGIRSRGLSDQFIFTGWVDEAASFVSILDVLVLPSLNEAVGRSLLEAQAVGVPVVATRVGGVPEVVKDRQTGVLVEPRNAEAVKDAILFLLRDEAVRLKMAQEARRWADEKFSAAVMVEKFDELYQRMVNTDA